MRITNLRAVQPPTPDSPKDWRTSLGQILVAVDTDSGLTGYGVGGGGAASIHVVQTVLRDLLLDEDPTDVEALWRRMYRATMPYGRKGLAIMALSGVDLALWDLRGKTRGLPVAELLGGGVGKPIPTYITLTGSAEEALAAGYRAMKVHFRLSAEAFLQGDEVVEHVEKTRAAIGPDCELMCDAFMSWDVETTLRYAETLRAFDLQWIEEPLPPDDWDGYVELCRRSPIPIAGGEHEYTAKAFSELIDRGVHHVLQPDVCWCGGMTELVKIYEMANRSGLRVGPHRGSEPWSLHAIAALDPRPLAESGRPWMTWVGGRPNLVDGKVQLGDAPGFGVEIDPRLLA